MNRLGVWCVALSITGLALGGCVAVPASSTRPVGAERSAARSVAVAPRAETRRVAAPVRTASRAPQRVERSAPVRAAAVRPAPARPVAAAPVAPRAVAPAAPGVPLRDGGTGGSSPGGGGANSGAAGWGG